MAPPNPDPRPTASNPTSGERAANSEKVRTEAELGRSAAEQREVLREMRETLAAIARGERRGGATGVR